MREADAQRLTDAIKHDFPRIEPDTGFPWDANPPVKIVDCVLSLNRRYYAVVRPRVLEFRHRFASVTSCADLRELIGGFAAPSAFLEQTLRTRDARRAETLVGVTNYAIDIQRRFAGTSEEERLRQWALWARPGDYLSVGVPGFGLAGFQYLRMLFGAQTTKPDVHIVGYVSKVLGRTVSDIGALYTLERAAEIANLPLRWLDAAIWTQSARQ